MYIPVTLCMGDVMTFILHLKKTSVWSHYLTKGGGGEDWTNITTVKPVLRGHLWDKDKVTL